MVKNETLLDITNNTEKKQFSGVSQSQTWPVNWIKVFDAAWGITNILLNVRHLKNDKEAFWFWIQGQDLIFQRSSILDSWKRKLIKPRANNKNVISIALCSTISNENVEHGHTCNLIGREKTGNNHDFETFAFWFST